jgi:hypothetical protein
MCSSDGTFKYFGEVRSMSSTWTLARLFAIIFAIAVAETSCGGGGSNVTTPPLQAGGSNNQLTTTNSPASNFYVLGGSSGTDHLAIFAANDTSTIPIVNLNLGSCGLTGQAQGVFVDTSGKVYVVGSFFSAGAVIIFSPLHNGQITQIATITGSQTGLSDEPRGVAVDASGKIYVANGLVNTITIYAPGASGDALPIASISGPHTQLNEPFDVKLDAQGNIYVANTNGHSITKYVAGATGDATPIATIAGPNSELGSPTALALDAKGRLFVVGFSDSLGWGYFAAGADGNVAPAQTIKPPVGGSTGIAVDGADTVYTVAEFTDGSNVFRYPVAPDGMYSNSNVSGDNIAAETFFINTAQIAVH